jgi:hypothetical protein
LFHAITIGRKVRILFAPIYFRPAYAQIADDSDRSNVTKTKAFSHREASGADQSRRPPGGGAVRVPVCSVWTVVTAWTVVTVCTFGSTGDAASALMGAGV